MNKFTKGWLSIVIDFKRDGSLHWEEIAWVKTFDIEDYQYVSFSVPDDWCEIMKDASRRVQMLTECIRGIHPLKDGEELNSDIAELIKDVSIDPDTAARIEEMDYDRIREIRLDWEGGYDGFCSYSPVSSCKMDADTGEVKENAGGIFYDPQSPLKAEVF